VGERPDEVVSDQLGRKPSPNTLNEATPRYHSPPLHTRGTAGAPRGTRRSDAELVGRLQSRVACCRPALLSRGSRSAPSRTTCGFASTTPSPSNLPGSRLRLLWLAGTMKPADQCVKASLGRINSGESARGMSQTPAQRGVYRRCLVVDRRIGGFRGYSFSIRIRPWQFRIVDGCGYVENSLRRLRDTTAPLGTIAGVEGVIFLLRIDTR